MLNARVRQWISAGVLIYGFASAASAQESFDDQIIETQNISGKIPLDFQNKVWTNAKLKTIAISPQLTVKLNDKEANQAIVPTAKKTLHIKAVTNNKDIGVFLEWEDPTLNQATPKETKSFGDSVAIEVPLKFGKGQRLPYIGMGDEGSWVQVDMARAAETATIKNFYTGAGFGSLTRRQSLLGDMTLAYDSSGKVWRAIFVRPLPFDEKGQIEGLLPTAFAVWDGDKNERGGNKYISSWFFIKLDKFKISEEYQKEMSFGYGAKPIGDAEKGKAFFNTTCMACHRSPSMTVALEGMAPNLSGIGSIASYGYLRDSILDPNQIVIRQLNNNRHYNKAETPDKFKAYPNNDTYMWYTMNEEGKRLSKMPSFQALPPETVNDLVAYLKSLK